MRDEMGSSLKWLFSQWPIWVLVILLALAPWSPDYAWVFLLLAGAWALVLFRKNHDIVRTVLSLLASISSPVAWALTYWQRQQELRDVAAGVDRALRFFGQELPQEKLEELEEFSSQPPYDTKEELVTACCRFFAAKLGSDPQVIELLYRDFHGEVVAGLWGRISPDRGKKQELVRLLVESSQLPEIEGIEAENMAEQEMKSLAGRTLSCLSGTFELKLVQHELRSWSRLWNHLTGYAHFLEIQGIPTALDMQALRDAVDRIIPGKLLHKVYDEKAEQVLFFFSLVWIGAWAKGKDIPESVAEDLAVLAVGIFGSEHRVLEEPLLAALGGRVTCDPGAFEMLLAYLWTKSQRSIPSPPALESLARDWRAWSTDARTSMRDGIAGGVTDKLARELREGLWPSLLPIERTLSEISAKVLQNSEELATLSSAVAKTDDWFKKMDRVYKRASGRRLPSSVKALSPEEIKKTVADAVAAQMEQVTPGQGAPREPRAFKNELDTYAQQFRPETHPLRDSGDGYGSPAAPASWRERAAGLGQELEEIGDRLLAEAGGARAYLITFDQSRGGLADLIDGLKKQSPVEFGFEHYTRYARIGLLRKDETFEDFYRRFEEALDSSLKEKLKHAAPGKWRQLEITVQPINLFHRHELIADAQGKIVRRVLDAAA